MATAYAIHIDPNNGGLLGRKNDEFTAAKASQLLQKDLERHHTFINAKGWHNHMAHHLLTLYSIGAGEDALQAAFDNNVQGNVETLDTHQGVFEELQQNWAAASKYLGQSEYYPDFLKYFQFEVKAKGWQEVLVEYMFSGEEGADDMFYRAWASFVHPLIQLMYGIEWGQPAIIAEALAQTAVHSTYVGKFLAKVENAATTETPPASGPSLPELIENVHLDQELIDSVQFSNPNEILDGVEVLCPDAAVRYLSQFRLTDTDEIEEIIAENIHTAAYMAAASVFHPPNKPRFDFFLIHHLTSSPLLLLVQEASWIPVKAKRRILEWKSRYDILHYAVRWCPPLHISNIANYGSHYTPRVTSMADLLPRFYHIPDDGHVAKTARSLLIARNVSEKYGDKAWIRIEDDVTWLNALYLLLDSTATRSDFPWVRSAGWNEAWRDLD